MLLHSVNIIFCVLLKIWLVDCFNLDTKDYVFYHGEPKSMFGFSVASHRDRGDNWLIVGAPEAQTRQPSVIRGGAVFRCRPDGDDLCQIIPFDTTGNNNNSNFQQLDEKSRQWFGATVQSGGPDKPIVACAPRYLWYTTLYNRRDPVGTCFVANGDFSDYREYSPCRTRHWGYHRQGTCQAGLSAAVAKDGERLFIGAPGSWYWQGQMYSVDPSVRFAQIPRRKAYYTVIGQIFQQNLKNRPEFIFTREGSFIDDDSYMGYSVTVGNFTGESRGGIAVGMPRGNDLKGKVLFYTWDLNNYKNISGDQLGSYFGYCVASADVDGNGIDEVIVGAPLYTEPNNEGKYEVGRVYIIYPVSNSGKSWADTKTSVIRMYQTRDGVSSKGRFGQAIASLGDLDLDGYHDIAIGAPYAGPDERGAVYIYYGSSKGLREKPSQIIHAADLPYKNLYTFGFSLSGNGIDLDNNQYPDLVVGAYLSDMAYVFRSRPVINVKGSIQFLSQNKQINLEERNCRIGNKSVSCTTINVCVEYSGVGVSDFIKLQLQFLLDAKKQKEPRLFLYPSERTSKFNETWPLQQNNKRCEQKQILLKDNPRDKLTALEVELRYSLLEEQNIYHTRNPRSILTPVVNGNLPSVYKDSIVIQKNCGPDDVCIPNLKVSATPNVEKYLYGSGKRLEIEVKINNDGEDSFESMFYMKMPPGINYINTKKPDSVKCSAPSPVTDNTLKCDIGNPLPKDKMVQLTVLLDPFTMEGMKPSYDFAIEVNSTNPENEFTLFDNKQNLAIGIWVKTNLSLTGWPAHPEHYNASQYTSGNYTSESEIGPLVVHIYTIKNNGPSGINEAEAHFIWPHEILAGDDLLYLVEQPDTLGPIKCEFANANPLKVDLERKKSYIGSNSITDQLTSTKITTEEKKTSVTTNVGDGDSSGGEYHGVFSQEDKFENTGDASFVHQSRRENSTDKTGGLVKETTYVKQWNTTTVNGKPVVTHSWSQNTSTTSGSGQSTITQRPAGQGSQTKYTIHYSSTGGRSDNGSRTNNYAVSQQSGSTQTGAWGQSGTFEQSGTSYHQSGSKFEQSGSKFEHGGTKYGESGSVVEHSESYFGAGGSTSGQFGTRIEVSTTEKSVTHFDWSRRQQGGLQEENIGGVSTIHHASNAEKKDESQVFGGTIDGGSVHQQGSVTHQGGVMHQGGVTHHGGATHSTSWQTRGTYSGDVSESQVRRMLQTGQGEFSNRTHRLRWTTNPQGVSLPTNLPPGVLIERGHFQNSTHFVQWTNEIRNSSYRPLNIPTEESVNTRLDEYADRVRESDVSYGRARQQLTNQASRGVHVTTSAERSHGSHIGVSAGGGSSARGSSERQGGTHSTSGHGGLVAGTTDFGSVAGNRGFRTNVVGLETITGSNAEENVSGNEEDNYEEYEQSYYDPDLDSYEQRGANEHHQSGVSYGVSRTFSNEKRYSQDYDHNKGRDNVPTEHPIDYHNRRHYGRTKRETEDGKYYNNDDISEIVPCTATKCRSLRCVAGPLRKDEEVWVVLKFRANAQTLIKVGGGQPITVSTMVVSRISQLPYIGVPNDRPVHTHEVYTTISPTQAEVKKTDIVPLWAVVLSACAGAIILLLLIFLLYKCGFFKRNRPSDAPERQPLNRNGHYQGDEQL